jgi:hypothetical protein
MFGLVTFALLVGGISFTIYEMRGIANRPIEDAAQRQVSVTPATTVEN